jgi:WD40 repeat protein/tetratricopeptide (TPR) repeat protein/tRNA A-37 threonylcarbamoyl transferase component Bud32
MSDITVLFERSLRQIGTSLEVFLAEQTISTSDRNDADVVTQLACVDLTVAWERGGDGIGQFPPQVEDYSQRLPALSPAPLKLVEAEYRARLQRGESPDHNAFIERFSHLAEVLPQRLAAIDRSASSNSQITESDVAAETVIQPAAVDPSGTINSEVPPTIVESDAARSEPEDVETMIQSDGDAPTAPLRGTTGRGRGGASGVLRTFGDYEVLSEIARGGMGVVYRARQTKLNRVVAVKMILQGQLASRDDIQRFYSEAEAAARLEHPGIVPIFEVGEIDDQHYFSMGYVDGESLADRARRGPLPPREAAELLCDVADAIEYAHRNGVVHRDLKPGNILLTQDGQPRVTDFGLAKTVEGDSGLTASGQILGTPGYMPPEQASGRIHDVGPLADVYSLGAVLYCLLTGRPPFQSARVMETLKQVIETPPVSPRLLNPSVDKDLETIVLKCLEKIPAHRLTSAAELRDELQRYLNGESIRSRRVGVATRAWRWCRRKPLAAALVVSVFVLSGAVALTVELAKSAAQTRLLATAVGEFEQTLDRAEPTVEWLEQAEQVAERLEELAALHGEQQSLVNQSGEQISGQDARPRVFDTFATLIRRDLRKPKLDTGSAHRIQAAIQLLASRAPQMTDELQSLLNRRLTDWLVDFELAAPFAPVESQAQAGPAADRLQAAGADAVGSTRRSDASVISVFRPLTIDVSSDRLRPVGSVKVIEQTVRSGLRTTIENSQRTYLMAPLLPTKFACQDDVEIEATFASDWQTANEVGVALNAEETTGYDFVVKVLEGRTPNGGFDEKLELDSVEEVRQRGGKVVAEIRRHGVPLLREEIGRDALERDTLQLRARRSRGDLEFQINDEPPIRYYDPFPIGKRLPGVFALRWPADVSLLSLSARHRPHAEATTVLEVADALFDESDFAAAADQYRREMAESEDEATRQEARYKLGVCLTSQQRFDEAGEVLGPLMSQASDQWGALAGIQLWVTAVRRKEHENADAIFELLESRFRFEQLATLIPTEVRDEILANYLRIFSSVSNTFQFDPNRVRNVERGAAVDRLLSPDGRGRYGNQMELVRVYRFAEDWPKALAAIEPLVERSRDTVSMRHYTRILRFLGQPERAVNELDAVISGRANAFMTEPRYLVHFLVDRARAYYALNSPAAAEADLRQAVSIGLSNWSRGFDAQNHCLAVLMLGFLLESRGQREAARDVWRDGYLKSASIYHGLPSAYQTGLVARQALGSLTGELTAADGDQFLQLMTANDTGNSLVTMGTSLVTPQTITEALRDMWQSERGRQAAHDLAFETVPLRERLALPLLLMGHAFLRSKALGGVVNDEQDEVLWQAMRRSHRDLLELGKLKMPQLMQLALTWKGTTNFLGWGGVSPSLEADYRATMAWIFGHRYLRLVRREDALTFFEMAVRDAPTDSLTSRVAGRDAELLRTNQAAVTLRNSLTGLSVKLRRGGEVLATLSSESPQATVAAGDLEAVFSSHVELIAECDVATGSLSGKDELHLPIRLTAGSTATLRISQMWKSLSTVSPLPGLVPEPASLPGLGRWQIVRTSLQNDARGNAWSPDGRFVATSCDDGLIRVYETAEWKLARVYSGHLGVAHTIEWSPDSRYLLSCDYQNTVFVWDHSSGRLHCQPLPQQRNNGSVFWHPDSRSIGMGTYSGPGIRRVSLDGTLLEVFGDGSPLRSGSWSPDGRRLAAVNDHSGRFAIWLPETPNAKLPSDAFAAGRIFDVRNPDTDFPSFAGNALQTEKPTIEVRHTDDRRWHTVKWSPDGKRVATAGAGHVAVWDANGWKELHSWQTQSNVWIDWRRDGQELWACGWDRNLERRTFQPDDTVAEHVIQTPAHYIPPAISPFGDRFVRTAHGRMTVFDRGGQTLQDFENRERLIVASADWSPDGTRLAVAVDRQIQLLTVSREPATGQCVCRLTAVVQNPWGSVRCVRWAPDGSVLASCDQHDNVLLFNVDGEILKKIRVQGSPLVTLDWDSDSSRIVVLSSEGVIRFVARTGDVGEPLFDDEGILSAVEFSPDGKRLAAGGDRKVLRIWNVNGDAIEEPTDVPLDSRCLALRWSPDGQTIAVGCDHLELVRVSDSKVIRGPRVGQAVLDVDWIPSTVNQAGGALVVAVGNIGHAAVADSDGQLLKELRQPIGRLDVCRVSPIAGAFAIGTMFGSVELFDNDLLKPTGLVLIPSEGRCWSLSSTGQMLAESTQGEAESSTAPALPAANDSTTNDAQSDSGTDLRWLVESASGEQTLLTRAEFFERLRTLRSKLSAATPPPVRRENATALEAAGRLSDSSILEASGLVRSRRHAGVFWTVSDSGNPARLYAIDATGRLLARYEIAGAANNDWETVMADSSGTLWIGDVGNLGHRTVRTLYQLSEPDPRADAAAAGKSANDPDRTVPLVQLAVRQQITLRPMSASDDFEASFEREGRLYVISKVQSGSAAILQLHSNESGNSTAVELKTISNLSGLPWVTGAAISPDKRRLALTTYAEVLLFDLPSEGDFPAGLSPTTRLAFEAPLVESIAFEDDDTLLLLSETGDLSRLKLP